MARWRWNNAVYYQNFKNFQFSAPVTNPDGSHSLATSNADGAKVYGLESELAAKLTEVDKLQLSVAYTHTKLGHLIAGSNDYSLPVCTVPGISNCLDVTGHVMPHAPKLALQMQYEHQFRLSNGDTVTPRASIHYETKSWLSVFNLGDGDQQKAYTRHRPRPALFVAQRLVRRRLRAQRGEWQDQDERAELVRGLAIAVPRAAHLRHQRGGLLLTVRPAAPLRCSAGRRRDEDAETLETASLSKTFPVLAVVLAFVAGLAQAQTTSTLTVATFPDLDRAAKAAAPAWAKLHPEIALKIVSLQYPDHHTAMITAHATGSGLPDVMALDFPLHRQVRRLGRARRPGRAAVQRPRAARASSRATAFRRR